MQLFTEEPAHGGNRDTSFRRVPLPIAQFARVSQDYSWDGAAEKSNSHTGSDLPFDKGQQSLLRRP